MPNYIGTAQRHGKSNTPEYYSWQNMKDRCLNVNNKQWNDYGGRGISICEEWVRNFSTFYSDMGPRPEGTSLDRIDVNGDYTPTNCRWASKKEQSLNTRKRNTCGVVKQGNRWRVILIRNKVRYNVGYFSSYEEGLTARRQKEKELECQES